MTACVEGECAFECDVLWSDLNGDLDAPESDGCETTCEPTLQSEQVCDGLDDDCNGLIDEGLKIDYFIDDDGDGFGDGEPIAFCEPPPGYSARPGDCDDRDDTIYPGAAELCDLIDQNCNQAIDENIGSEQCPNQEGVCDGAEAFCSNDPAEFTLVSEGGECSETTYSNFSMEYQAQEQFCDDNLDNDCDGLSDCDDPDCYGVGENCYEYIFVTDQRFTGGVNPNIICETVGTNVDPNRNWVSLTSVGGSIDDSRAFVNPAANDVVAEPGQLFLNRISAPNRRADGVIVGGMRTVWTGLNNDGSSVGASDCDGFTNDQSFGTAGNLFSANSWLNSGNVTQCAFVSHFYCISQN